MFDELDYLVDAGKMDLERNRLLTQLSDGDISLSKQIFRQPGSSCRSSVLSVYMSTLLFQGEVV
jgi:hypothetical protein